jgi:head-tail adaptor
VHFGERIFAVTGVQNPEEKNVELVLACEEVVT